LANCLRDAAENCSGVYKALAPIEVTSSGAFIYSSRLFSFAADSTRPHVLNEGIEESPLYLKGLLGKRTRQGGCPVAS
jgi:hypothetical protein